MSKVFASLRMLLKLNGSTTFFWQNEDDNLNKISLKDARVTYFDTGYIICSICWERNCTDCKVLLLVDSEKQEQIEEYIPKDYMSLFDDANRRLSAITELCYAVTTLAVQAYDAVLLDSETRIKFWHLINSDVFLLKRYSVFLLHQLLSLARVAPKTIKPCTDFPNHFQLLCKERTKKFKLQKISATCKNAMNYKNA